ncbi:MAG: hypothetical protein ACD_3C00003G0006 [uncultured bacterium (gcode 4)]|uniref:Uncharacterized protein n=1 Tax=uncultured bacterium (gcode 4) TaxID=1234023 RepID=K2G3E4_9BACT|nr:MAG: hypothetical protein ACD_3C00003G0006 [uncultured bacterium (gcode 4)]
MWSASRFSFDNEQKEKSESDILKCYHDFLLLIEMEHGIKFSHEARKLHSDFFKLCFLYRWNLHWINHHMVKNGFDIVYNIWITKLDEIIEAEKCKIVKWELLIGAYFNDRFEITRYIIWKKEILLTKIINRVKSRVNWMGKVPCKQ